MGGEIVKNHPGRGISRVAGGAGEDLGSNGRPGSGDSVNFAAGVLFSAFPFFFSSIPLTFAALIMTIPDCPKNRFLC